MNTIIQAGQELFPIENNTTIAARHKMAIKP